MKMILLLLCLCLAPVPKAARKPLKFRVVWVGEHMCFAYNVTRDDPPGSWQFEMPMFPTEEACEDYIRREDAGRP